MTLPHFLVIGAPRAGTTTLANHLRAHPELFVPEVKELFFFTRPDGDLADYERHFHDAGGRRAGEATPMYLADPGAAPRMAATVPDARLVATLREPVSRAWSHYWHSRIWGHETRSFEQAVREELDAPGGAGEPGTTAVARPGLLGRRYVAVGHYHDQLTRLLEHFPADALHVVLFDDLRADLDGTLAGIYAHLGVGAAPTREIVEDIHNRSLALRSYRLHRFLWRHDLIRRLPRRLAFAIHNLNERPIPPLDLGLRRELADHFAPHNRRLEAWIGRPLPW